MTRVLMVIDGLWNGGAERQLTLLASSLPEPWTASVLSMEDGPYRTVLEGLGIEVHLTPRRFRSDVTAAARMWSTASRIDPDVVHAWSYMSALAMAPYCRARRTPLVHGAIRFGRLPSGGVRSFRLGISLSDAVVANSRAGLAAFGLDEDDRGRVVHNAFDPARLEVAAPGARPHDGRVAIMAARMSREKDWGLLLRAARRLGGDATPLTLVCVGSGPARDDIVARAADLVGAGDVRFPQGSLEVLPMIADADIGVLLTDTTYHAEGCSNTIMEYMACGLPVVCTDSGGNPELVEDGVSGMLVAPHDDEAVVTALRLLRDDPGRASAMGLAGRRRLEARFTVDTMVAGFVDCYQSVLEERGRPAR